MTAMLADCLNAVPALDRTIGRYMLETIGARLTLVSDHPASDLLVEVWTNLPTRYNSADTWAAIAMTHTAAIAGHHQFELDLKPTSPGNFELTYRIRHRDRPDIVQWLGHRHNNVRLQIAPPSQEMDWTQGPNHIEVLPGVYVGNFIAASQAASLGIDAVLNMAEELDLSLPTDGAIAYQKLSCLDGARHPIPEAHIRAAIAWIEQQRARGKQRILIHCRAGIGRSGSIGVAYCFHRHPHWSYQQALNYVWSKKPDVYPHYQLQPTLEKLFPRSLQVL